MRTAKVYVGVGHGGSDAGAVGILTEKNVNLKMAKACRDYLAAAGIDVMISRETDVSESLIAKINECNNYGADLAIDVHNNAGGGDGFEAYHTISYGKGAELAKNIEAEVLKIGQNSRGCKTKKNTSGKDYFGFIRQTKMPAVICEGVFVDNAADAAQADTGEECREFGEAYAKGIITTLIGMGFDVKKGHNKITMSAKREENKEMYTVRVTSNALRIRKGPGTNHPIVGVIRNKGVYTIVETSGNWGRLKNNDGWICLDFTIKI